MNSPMASALNSLKKQENDLSSSLASTLTSATSIQKNLMNSPMASALNSLKKQENDLSSSLASTLISAASIQKNLMNSPMAGALNSLKKQEHSIKTTLENITAISGKTWLDSLINIRSIDESQDSPLWQTMSIIKQTRQPFLTTSETLAMQDNAKELIHSFTHIQQTLQRISNFYPVVLTNIPTIESILPSLHYLQEEAPELYQQVDVALLADTECIEKSNINLKTMRDFIVMIIANLLVVYNINGKPAYAQAIGCLIIIFNSYLFYINYCINETEN